MATRPPLHPPLEGEPPISQPGAISSSVRDRIPFGTDPPTLDEPLDPDAENAKQAQKAAFLTLAIDRWRTVDQAESALRAEMREDLNFFASDQWPTKIRQQRELDGRPCLTINRLPGFVRQLTNEMRDARPGMEVIPVDNVSDPALAEVFQGLFQHIEANSDADVAYARATEDQVRVGRGYFRILPEYASDTGFEQELRIKSIRNQATVYFDQASQELDGSDGRFCLIVDDIPESEYDARWGKESRISLDQFSRVGERLRTWKPEGKVRIAEYYSFVPKTRTIHQMANGWVLDDEDLERMQAAAQAQQQLDPQFQPPDFTPVKSRTVEGRQLTWALINGAEILEGNEDHTGGRALPGRWIPIIPVYGEEIDLDGTVDLRGIIRDGKDAQRMNNFWKSAETETVALAPKAPFVAEEGQIEGHEQEWQQSNVKNYAVLRYKAKALDGHLIGPPQRNTAEPPIQAMAMMALQMENDLRATTGFSYDVGANEKRVEQSGRAILARQAQGEKGNSHFSAHLAVSLRHAGRILLDLIPQYYDTARVKRILGRDGQYQTRILHAGDPQGAAKLAAEQNVAENKIHDLSAGRYDVRVKAGVSYASERQATQELLGNILQTNPQMMQIVGDIFFEYLDSPVATRLSRRMQKALPPTLQDAPEEGPPPIPPQVQQQLQQAGQLIDALTQRVNEMTEEQKAKHDELASKERIAQMQANTQMTIEQAKIAAAQALAQIQAESQQAVASQKLAVQVGTTERQIASTESQMGAKLGAEQAIAMLEARMRQIEQMFELDMARLQAATQAPDSPSSPAPAPPAGAAPSPPGAMPPVPDGPPPMAPPTSPAPVG